MITRFLKGACMLALVLSATSVAQEANAEVMFWVFCDCDPNNEDDFNQVRGAQVNEHADVGVRFGYETGDTIVLQNDSAVPNTGRWTYQPGGYRVNTSSTEDFTCDTTWGLGDFDACIDLTPGGELGPPWILPDQDPPTMADVYCYLQNLCSNTYGITFGTPTGYPALHYYDVDIRHNDASWFHYASSGHGYCNADWAPQNTKVDVRVTLYSVFGTVQCEDTLYTYLEC